MLSGMDDMEQKGVAAAASYLERAGFSDIEPCGPDMVAAGFDLTAVDGGERVAVTVTVSLRHGEFGEPRSIALPDGFDRVDAMGVLVITPDRALLRHHRGVASR